MPSDVYNNIPYEAVTIMYTMSAQLSYGNNLFNI